MIKSNERKPDVHFRLTREEYERLCSFAEAERRSLSNLIEKIVLEWLAEQGPTPRRLPHNPVQSLETRVGSR